MVQTASALIRERKDNDMKLVITEKPSVAKSISAVLGADKRRDGYCEGGNFLVSWCFGHLAELASAEVYDEAYAKWSREQLPIIPESWQYSVGRDKKKQLDLLTELMRRSDVTEIVNACDAGREGELIFRTVYLLAGCVKPVKRLWISSMEDAAIREGFANLRDGSEYDHLYDAVIAIEPPVQENPEPETDTPADPAISVEARNAYGYTDDAMLPLTKERAMELFERDVPVYLLYGDNTEAMAFEQTEILNHDGIFGIDRADWEAVKEQFPVATENRWQKAFQQNPADSYCIYQLRRDPELAELRFMNSQYLREHGLEPAFDHYEAVYSGSLPSDGSTEARLDDLYMKFNTAHPQDFTGHSLSVSDIVVLKQQGAVSSHYVDSVGFVQFPAFLPDNYLKNAEMSMEDDYGMIDGIINNGPKEQPETKPKAPDLSALFEAASSMHPRRPEAKRPRRRKAQKGI